TEAEREDPFAAALAKAERDTSPLDFEAPAAAELAEAEPALSFDAAPAEDPDAALFADEPRAERALTTRELIEQARAAARAAPNERSKKPKLRDKIAKSERAARPPLFSGFGAPPKKRVGSTLPTALLFAGGAAALGVAATGVVILTGDPAGAPPTRVAGAMGGDGGGQEILTAEVDAAPTPPRAAVALSPKLLGPSSEPVGLANAAAQANLPSDFAA